MPSALHVLDGLVDGHAVEPAVSFLGGIAAALMNLAAVRMGGPWEQFLRGSGRDWQT